MYKKTQLVTPAAMRSKADPRLVADAHRTALERAGGRTAVVLRQSNNKAHSALHRCRGALAATLLAFTGLSFAEQPAYYAGLAYLGDFQYVDRNYPMTQALNADAGALDRQLRADLEASTPEHLDLRFTLGDIDRTETLVLAVALDRERVSREVLELQGGVRTKLIVEISLQILLYDLAGGYLVDNVPVSAAVNHVLDGNVQDVSAEALGLARSLYEGDADFPGLLTQAVAAIARIDADDGQGLRYQLASVELHPRVLPLLPEGVDERLFRQRLGQTFSARLAEQTGVSVIPFTRGYAIGNQLPGRFANGEAFNLKLPEPDYAFHVELKNLSRHETETDLLFGAQAYFSLEEPFTGSVSIAGDYRAGVFKPAADFRLEADDWSAYEDAAENLLDDLVVQLRAPDRSWHKQHARSPLSFGQFNGKKELFNE